MTPDVAIVSLGTTLGWRQADAALASMLSESGVSCEVVPVQIGRAGRLRRTMAMVDLVESLAARSAAKALTARTVIYSSVTAALLQRPSAPYAVRFDTVAVLSRPGPMGAWQRRREPAVLAGARVLLPWSPAAAQAALNLIEPRGTPSPPAMITLPVPIEPVSGSPVRDIDAIAYAADPRKRGLDLLCAAWRVAAPVGARLIVGGIGRDQALDFLRRAGQHAPDGVTWEGRLSRSEWLERVGRAKVFVNASRYEDWGIAQLEALSAGTPLVTVPTPGPNEALGLARRLAPELVTRDFTAQSLGSAIRLGLRLADEDRAAYGAAASGLLAPYRYDVVRRIVAQEVVPALLRSSS